jgi:hypothetical protein
MTGKTLELMRYYLCNRFIRGVTSGLSSSLKQIFSGVPQGGKWSAFLWDFDISEMCHDLQNDAQPFGYADDVSLLYEIDPDLCSAENVKLINGDLATLHAWGCDNNTTFERSEMEMVLVSQKRVPFDPSGIWFDGFMIPLLPQIKLVGFTLDSKLRW